WVRELTADYDRSEQRRRVAHSEIERFHQEKQSIETTLVQAEAELIDIRNQTAAVEQEIHSRSEQSERLRVEVDNVRRDVAELQSKLAVLEERRSTILREINTLRQLATQLDDRAKQAERQI